MTFLHWGSLLQGILLSSSVAATISTAPPKFSPYVDFTLNTSWDSQLQDLVPMDLHTPAKSQGIKGYHLAFITDSGICKPAWGGQPDYALNKSWGKREADRLYTDHVSITASFGGANGTDISLSCSQNELLNIFGQVIEQYHAQQLDFDIENGTADVPKLMNTLKILQKTHPETQLSFTLPVMPEGLTLNGEQIINAAKEADLTFHVNIMAMDYGPAYGGNMGNYAIQAATNVHHFLTAMYPQQSSTALWKSIEVTPMIGVNDVQNEQFTLADADKLKAFAMDHLGGLSMWSFNRDKPCADKWATTNCSGMRLQQRDYEFSAHMK